MPTRTATRTAPVPSIRRAAWRSTALPACALLTVLVSAILASGPAAAALDPTASTDDHSINTPTSWWTYTNVSPATLGEKLGEHNARLVDLEVMSVTSSGEPRFTARMVPSTGTYGVPGWWWYYDQTAAQIATLLSANSGRLIELERYDRGGGQIRYAAVMVSNTGAAERGWSYLLGVTAAQITDHINDATMRPIDIDTYGTGSAKRYNAVFVSNTGADYKAFEWWVNQTPAGIASKAGSYSGRVVKIERQEDGKYVFVQVKNTSSNSSAWWHRYGFGSMTDLNNYAAQMAARPVDIVTYLSGGLRRYDAAFIDNADLSTRRMRGAYATFIDGNGTPRGIHEAYMKRVNSSVTVNLNAARRAETASTFKAVHLLHSLRQVQLGADTLGSNFVYYNYPDPSGLTEPKNRCPDPAYENSSSDVYTIHEYGLDMMMNDSDNRTTRGVVLRSGGSFGPINSTAAWAGLTGTTLRHNIGCGYGNPATGTYSPSLRRNDTTAADLARLYEGVWNGTLLTSTNRAREEFLESANPVSGASAELQAIINEEAAKQGKSSLAALFGQRVKTWGKDGSYGTCLGAPDNAADCGQKVLILGIAGLIQLPVGSGAIFGTRTYAYSSLISDVPINDWASPDASLYTNAYRDARVELFRDEIREALKLW